jgi:(E)-4-hydroxy-3-methylbut-2-enyl-diphosphate synthase
VAGGDGKGLIFAKGEIIKTVSEESLADELMDMIEKHFREYFG